MPNQTPDIMNTSELGPQLVVAELKSAKSHPVEISLPQTAESQVAELLELSALRKTRLQGTLRPLGKRDWQFKGHLGATVVQPCVVTLEPVTTRIEEDIERIWRADFDDRTLDDDLEVTEATSEEPLEAVIDLGALLLESLALFVPLYPRTQGAELDEAVFTEPGEKPMTDEDARPFAGLAALKDKLTSPGNDEEG